MSTSQIMLGAAILLAAAGIALLAGRRLHVGSIVAMLFAGVVVGPHTPLAVAAGHIDQFQAVGEIGVILLLFAVGLDVRPAELWASRRAVAALGAGQYLTAVLGIMVLVLLLTPAPWNVALVVGLGLAMSSDAIAFPSLASHGDADSRRGHIVLAVEVFQSFMVAPVLLLVPVLARHAMPGGPSAQALLRLPVAILAVLALVFVVLPQALRWASRSMGSGAFVALVLGGALFGAWISDWAGASAAGGAFLMGLLMSNSVFAPQIKAVVAPARQVLLALFFVSIGMAIDPREITSMGRELLLAVPATFAAKLAAGYLVMRIARLAPRDALVTSLLLVPLDEIAFVIFAGARDNGLLDAHGYTLALAVLSASFVLSPLAIDAGYKLASRRTDAPDAPVAPVAPPVDEAVLQVGYGPIGRTVCKALELAGIHYACIDDDLDNVARGRSQGHNVTYGRIADASSLWAFGVDRARLVVVATDSFTYAGTVAKRLHEFQPGVPAAAAVMYLTQREQLRALGLEHAFAVAPEGILAFVAQVLRSLGTGEERVAAIVDAMRRDDYRALRPEPARAAGADLS